MNISAETEEEIEPAYKRYYSALADHLLRHVPGLKGIRRVLEVGAGRGQLTIPLLRKLPRNAIFIAADSSKGPYVGWLDELGRTLQSEGVERRVRILRSDARKLKGVGDMSVQLIVSNEVLCDLTRDSDLLAALAEFHRVLEPGGRMVHGEWSSFPEDGSQSIIVKHWPSWSPDQLYSFSRKAGFHDFRVTYFDTTISFSYKAALKELQDWGAKESFLRDIRSEIRKSGVRLPYEHVVSCRK